MENKKSVVFLTELKKNKNNYEETRLQNPNTGDYFSPSLTLKIGLKYNCERCECIIIYKQGFGGGYPLCSNCYKNIEMEKNIFQKGKCLIDISSL